MSKTIPFKRPAIIEEPTTVDTMLCEALDRNFKELATLGICENGFYHFRCSEGVSRIQALGALEFLKMELFASMEPVD